MPVEYLECPCCGDEGAESDANGYFLDGQKLICACNGNVCCDSETEPYVLVDDCDCADRPAQPPPKGGG